MHSKKLNSDLSCKFRVPANQQKGRGHFLRSVKGPVHQELKVHGYQVYESTLLEHRIGKKAMAAY
jgi:hypothetical protein